MTTLTREQIVENRRATREGAIIGAMCGYTNNGCGSVPAEAIQECLYDELGFKPRSRFRDEMRGLLAIDYGAPGQYKRMPMAVKNKDGSYTLTEYGRWYAYTMLEYRWVVVETS